MAKTLAVESLRYVSGFQWLNLDVHAKYLVDGSCHIEVFSVDRDDRDGLFRAI